MNTAISNSPDDVGKAASFFRWTSLDGLGIAGSALCAVHCALTPVLLLSLPALGSFWAHPATHWILALFIIPVALFIIPRGYMRHKRKWVIASCCLGILLVAIGTVKPHWNQHPPGEHAAHTSHTCCPHVEADDILQSGFSFNSASILVTLGGFFLIAAHLGNVCRCRTCQTASNTTSKK